jgi:hypothetical protein
MVKHTLLVASRLEPRSISHCTTGKLPLYEAQLNEVLPSCNISRNTLCTARRLRASLLIRLAMLVAVIRHIECKGLIVVLFSKAPLLKRILQLRLRDCSGCRTAGCTVQSPNNPGQASVMYSLQPEVGKLGVYVIDTLPSTPPYNNLIT